MELACKIANHLVFKFFSSLRIPCKGSPKQWCWWATNLRDCCLTATECPNDLWLMWRNQIIPFPCHFLDNYPCFQNIKISEKQKHVLKTQPCHNYHTLPDGTYRDRSCQRRSGQEKGGKHHCKLGLPWTSVASLRRVNCFYSKHYARFSFFLFGEGRGRVNGHVYAYMHFYSVCVCVCLFEPNYYDPMCWTATSRCRY